MKTEEEQEGTGNRKEERNRGLYQKFENDI